MKRNKIVLSISLVALLCVGILVGCVVYLHSLPTQGDTIDQYSGKSETAVSFFEEEFKNIDVENAPSFSPYYDALPDIDNDTNFQSHGTSSYANINGVTVTADAFYSEQGEPQHDPNVGCGLLIYQCIQYKMAHPEEEVRLTFSTYRLSVTAAVCVRPDSKYYGYMRSLFDKEYDEHGFVRISYMMVEAARMGIKVTIVGQANSYGVKQYDPATGKVAKKTEPMFVPYFESALDRACYDDYAQGDRVRDHMTFVKVKWTLADKGGTDMMHVKSCTASHYLATDGTEHRYGVWFSSSNLDATDYLGNNGNNGSQSGVLLTNHERIYWATYNYIYMMVKYQEQEALTEMQYELRRINTEQGLLFQQGRGHEIPNEELLLYLGSETDEVFEVYFTPLGGSTDMWDLLYNPYAKYINKMYNSEDYIIFTWNVPTYSINSFQVSGVLTQMVNEAFTVKNPNPNNRISLKVRDYDLTPLKTLVEGETVGYKYLANSSLGVHNKDILTSYVENGVRYYVSLLTSCNFHSGAIDYQTNTFLIIKETDETGNDFFLNFGNECSSGAIVKDDGSVWEGADVTFVGDSITAGSGTDKTYYDYLAEQIPFGSVTEMGLAGSCISSTSDYGSNNGPLTERYVTIPDSDLIVIFMGTNDYGHETPLGTITDKTDVSFYGALNVVIEGLKELHPDSQLVFVTPLHRYGFGTSSITGEKFTYDYLPNGRGHTLGDYVHAMIEVCAQHEVSVIDLYADCDINPTMAAIRNAYMPDGLHPNAAGHKLIAEVLLPAIEELERLQPSEDGSNLQYGNKFSSGYEDDPTRVSTIMNIYLTEGQVVTLLNPEGYQWAIAGTIDEDSTDKTHGYYPVNGWSSESTFVVEEAGYYGFVLVKIDGSVFRFDDGDSSDIYDYISVE